LKNNIRKDMRLNVNVKGSLGTFEQTFSHFKLTLHVFDCETADAIRRGKWVSTKNLDHLAMSRIHRHIAKIISDGKHKI
jgi:adenine-specific DNA glycosylase